MLYIHIPYCKGKCIYCDFYSAGNPDWERYLKALANELQERRRELGKSLYSVYIGGGTPSLIPAERFVEFISRLRDILISGDIEWGSGVEFTIEANPEDVDEGHIKAWKEAGVNRVSMGVQSLVDSELQMLRRRHDARKAVEAARMLRNNFVNISLDLIYGIPGQTEESLRTTLREFIDICPDHISAYSLTYEEGTPLFLLAEKGKISGSDDEEYLKFDSIVAETLRKAGYERYEISNYCKPGRHSRHNSGYWEGRAYLGLGPSASSYNGRDIRRNNPGNLKRYMEMFGYDLTNAPPTPPTDFSNTRNAFYEEENLSTRERLEERIMIELRTARGIDLDSFRNSFGDHATSALLKKANRWLSSGALALTQTPSQNFALTSGGLSDTNAFRLALTSRGLYICDTIILSLISL